MKTDKARTVPGVDLGRATRLTKGGGQFDIDNSGAKRVLPGGGLDR